MAKHLYFQQYLSLSFQSECIFRDHALLKANFFDHWLITHIANHHGMCSSGHIANVEFTRPVGIVTDTQFLQVDCGADQLLVLLVHYNPCKYAVLLGKYFPHAYE